MKYELSHDILAKKVYEKSSQDDKMLRKIESFIKERHEYFLAQGVMLVKEDLEYISPYLAKVNVTPEEKAFVENSRKQVKRNEGRKLITTLAIFVLPVLVALLAWALYQTYEANRAFENANAQSIIAKEKESEAKKAKEEAVAQKQIAILSEQEAQKQKVLAITQSQIVNQQAIKLAYEVERAKQSAEQAEKERKKAEYEAKRAEKASQRAEREALQAQKSEKNALAALEEAKKQKELALKARVRADKAAEEARKAEKHAQKKEKEARALYLASLADNALRLKKGIVAYNLAKLSWNKENNLMAQKVLFDCQNAYLTDQSIFKEYEEQSFQTYQGQVAIQFDKEKQVKNIEDWARNVRDQVELGSIYKAVFSNDRKLLALLLLNKVFIRDTDKNKTIATIPLKSKARSIYFSSDDQLILIVMTNNTVELHAVEGGLIKKLEHDSPIVSAAFSPKGKSYITTVSEDKKGKLWDEKGEVLKGFEVFDVNSETYPFGDGQSIFRLSKKNELELVNVFSNKTTTFDILKKQNNIQVNTSLSSDGQYVLTHTSENIVQLWTANGKLLQRIAAKENPEEAHFSPNGQEIITSSVIDRKAKLWDLQGNQLAEFNYDGFDKIQSIEFSEDRMRVLVCRTKIANLWGKKGRLLYSFSPEKPIISTSFSADNQSILIATKDGELESWNIVTPEKIIKYYDDAIAMRELTEKEKEEYEILASDSEN